MRRILCILLSAGCLAFAQDGQPASQESAPAPHQSGSSTRRVSSVRRSTRAGNKPRKIKMQKMKNMPKFKKPRKS